MPYKLYTGDNSNIESYYKDRYPNYGYYYYHRVDGLTYDKQGNLWFLNPANQNLQIKYLTSEGQIYSMPYGDSRKWATPQDIIIDKRNSNLKWVLVPRTEGTNAKGLFVFNDNGTLRDSFDD